MKIIFLFIIFFLSGCATVTWDGGLPGREYEITFHDTDGYPVQGVVASCIGNSIWPSEEMAKEINNLSVSSDKNGLMLLKHDSYGVHGSYKQLGRWEWGHSKSGEVTCDFLYNGKIVNSGKLYSFNQPSIVKINTNEI
ncbi:hypothetical protein ACJJIR_12635 [Microbulbifer sp. SSSA008]